MAYFDSTWYCNAGDQSTTGYYAVTKWATGATIAAGALRRQNAAPAVGSERVFVAIVGGTTHATTEPTWVITRGGKTTDNTVTWQECTGASAVNGDLTNTANWTQAKAIGAPTLGAIIKRNNGASFWICITAGTLGASEPAWPNDTAGTTQADGTTTWTCLGVAGNFTGGQAPHARLANACATNWFAAGNTVYVGDNHAESQATTINITPAASANLVNRILCHNHAGSYPPASTDLTTGASISTTASVSINFSPSPGLTYVYGLAFLAGVGGSNNASINLSPINAFYSFEKCLFKQATTFGNTQVSLGSNNAGAVLWNNCTVYFGNVNQYIDVESTNFTWQNTGQVLAAGSLVPSGNGLISNIAAARLSIIVLEALDLSQLTGPVFGGAGLATYGNWVVKDCKLNASASFATPFFSGQTTQVVRSDSGATAYKSARYQYEGTETTETSITRVGGAADPTGQAQSRKIVTTANSQWLRPFKAEPYAIWNPTTGANVTVTVYGTVNAGALPNNDDIWLEVEYLAVASGSAGSSTTSYSNPGGQGDRTASISITTDLAAGAGTASMLINGTEADEYWWATGQTSKYMTFDFGVARIIDEFTWTQGSSVTHGSNQTFAGSNDNISYTNLSTTVALGSSATTVVSFTNTTAYRYYRLTVPGATSSGPYLREIKFKIDLLATPPAMYGVIVNTTKSNVLATGSAVASDGSTWNGGGSGAGWSPFKLTATLSSPQPGMAGYLHARVRAAKPSTTLYIDPKIVLT